MPFRLDVKRKLLARSDRVKCVDLHPSEAWMLVSLYNGNVHIWNYETQQLVQSFEVCDLPVRAARFITRKNWVVTGSDDMHMRVTFVFTTSDDMLVKRAGGLGERMAAEADLRRHTNSVMQVGVNPKDTNTFATALLDKTVKVWQLASQVPNFTLEGHEKLRIRLQTIRVKKNPRTAPMAANNAAEMDEQNDELLNYEEEQDETHEQQAKADGATNGDATKKVKIHSNTPRPLYEALRKALPDAATADTAYTELAAIPPRKDDPLLILGRRHRTGIGRAHDAGVAPNEVGTRFRKILEAHGGRNLAGSGSGNAYYFEFYRDLLLARAEMRSRLPWAFCHGPETFALIRPGVDWMENECTFEAMIINKYQINQEGDQCEELPTLKFFQKSE